MGGLGCLEGWEAGVERGWGDALGWGRAWMLGSRKGGGGGGTQGGWWETAWEYKRET